MRWTSRRGRSGVAGVGRVLASVALLAAATAAAQAPPRPAEVRVVAAWATGPFEARVALDRPADPSVAQALVGRTIAFDETKPKAGEAPAADTRGSLRVAAARLDDGGRTLVLTTDPHPRTGTYALEIPDLRHAGSPAGTPARPVSVVYELTGVEAESEGSPRGWWPSFDPADLRKLGVTPAFESAVARLGKEGQVTLTSLVLLPSDARKLLVAGPKGTAATLGGEEPAERPEAGPLGFPVEPTGEPALLTVTLSTGAGPVSLQVSVQPEKGPARPVGARDTLLPWVPSAPGQAAALQNVPDLNGGDPARGAKVFASAEAKCSTCHKVRGQGGDVGPDLSNQAGRDRLEVYRDVAEPSARIHPDYVPYTLALKDGRVLVGTVRAEGADKLRVSDTEAKTTVVPRSEVEELRPSATSVMPVGLAGAIGEANLRDLIAFLTARPK